jgi:hypothetical protein
VQQDKELHHRVEIHVERGYIPVEGMSLPSTRWDEWLFQSLYCFNVGNLSQDGIFLPTAFSFQISFASSALNTCSRSGLVSQRQRSICTLFSTMKLSCNRSFLPWKFIFQS